MPININNLNTFTRDKLLKFLKDEYKKLNLPPSAARADVMKKYAKFGLTPNEVNEILKETLPMSNVQEQKALKKKNQTNRQFMFTGKAVTIPLFRGISSSRFPADPGDLGVGPYFTSNKSYAKQYGKVETKEIYLKNPLVLYGSQGSKLALEYGTLHGTTEERKKASKKLTKDLKKQGYDGIICFDYETTGDDFVVIKFPDSIED